MTTFPSRNVHRSQPRTSIALSVGRRARQGPLGCAAVAVDEVLILLVPDVGDPGESRGEALADLLAADPPGTPRLRPPRPFEDRVVGEMGHDPVEVVLVECRGDRLEHPHRVVVLHDSPPPYCHGDGRCVSGSKSGNTSVCSEGSAAGT